MKLARFSTDHSKGASRFGLVSDREIIDAQKMLEITDLFHEDDAALLADVNAVIAGWDTLMPRLQDALTRLPASESCRHDLGDVRLHAPVQPGLILCSGENYWDHRNEKPPVEGREPEFFIKAPSGVIGPGEDILMDHHVTSKLDYEVELAVVIGRPGRHIPIEQAMDHVFGFTVMNDCTARDRQVRMRPDGTCWYAVGPGKNFDTCAPLGPVVVTRDEIADPQALPLRCRVNGEIRQSNTTAKMIWPVTELVHFFSTYLTLQPGWIISTGTPGGTAWASDPELGGRPYERDDIRRAQGYLKDGDLVLCEIDGIGAIENRVKAV